MIDPERFLTVSMSTNASGAEELSCDDSLISTTGNISVISTSAYGINNMIAFYLNDLLGAENKKASTTGFTPERS
jgi:hypothetical protein